MLPNLFESEASFRAAFVTGLNTLLDHDALGVFILVQANASFDAAIQTHLSDHLHHRYNILADRYRTALREGHPLNDAADDAMVFLKLMAMGINHFHPTVCKQQGPWELQYNQLRALRPRRNADAQINRLSAPYDSKSFNFNKPFLKKEMFWRGQLQGRHVDLLYNKFPFLPLHALLVPEAEQGHPQALTQDLFKYTWDLTESLGLKLPGIGFGYNSYGAFASVNHLHFQMFIRNKPLPVAHPQWQHNGGEKPYPSPCNVFTNVHDAWAYLSQLDTAYNLIFMPGKLYCLSRRFQGSYSHSKWTGGYAFYEMAGGLTTFNRDAFEALNAQDLTKELAKTAL